MQLVQQSWHCTRKPYESTYLPHATVLRLSFYRPVMVQVIFGVTAVIMPGSILGSGAVVGAIAASDIGQELAGNTLYMGVPAMGTTKHDAGKSTQPLCLLNQDTS